MSSTFVENGEIYWSDRPKSCVKCHIHLRIYEPTPKKGGTWFDRFVCVFDRDDFTKVTIGSNTSFLWDKQSLSVRRLSLLILIYRRCNDGHVSRDCPINLNNSRNIIWLEEQLQCPFKALMSISRSAKLHLPPYLVVWSWLNIDSPDPYFGHCDASSFNLEMFIDSQVRDHIWQ